MIKKTPLPLLAVGGLDPSGQAGLFADVRVFESLGLPYRVATTAITAQSEKKFLGWEPVDLKLFRAQLAASGPKLAGVKIGMLATAKHLQELSRWLKKARPPWVVWDPVWRSSTGGQLFRGKASDFFSLLPQVDIWTPNLPEAELFLGQKIRNWAEAHRAAIEIWRMGKKKSRLAVLKGGHLSKKEPASDWVIDENGIHELRGTRLAGSRRGTGCAFASALVSALVSGKNPLDGVRFAKAYVRTKLFAGNRRGQSLD